MSSVSAEGMALNCTATTDDSAHQAVQKLGRELLLVLALQAFGFACQFCGLTPPFVSAGLGWFVAKCAQPALFFHTISTLDLSAVEPAVLITAFTAKALIASFAASVGAILVKESAPAGEAWSTAGLFSLCVTCSDDVAVGVPLIGAIFSKEMVSNLFVLAAMSAGIFNPIAFVLLGMGAAKHDAAQEAADAAQTGAAATPTPSLRRVVLTVLGGLCRNPLILSVLAGAAWRLTTFLWFGGSRGLPLPFLLNDLTENVGAAFKPLVLFLSGQASVGVLSKLTSLRMALLPAALASLQSFLMPISTWLIERRT
jgi:predicted permease